jgi:hypothetical protein
MTHGISPRRDGGLWANESLADVMLDVEAVSKPL